MFDAIWGSNRHHLPGKKVWGMAFKKGTYQHENKILLTCPEAPGEAAPHAHFANTKQQLGHKFPKSQLKLMSCVRECCLSLFPLHSSPILFELNIRTGVHCRWPNMFSEIMKTINVKKPFSMTRPWPRPGELRDNMFQQIQQ